MYIFNSSQFIPSKKLIDPNDIIIAIITIENAMTDSSILDDLSTFTNLLHCPFGYDNLIPNHDGYDDVHSLIQYLLL